MAGDPVLPHVPPTLAYATPNALDEPAPDPEIEKLIDRRVGVRGIRTFFVTSDLATKYMAFSISRRYPVLEEPVNTACTCCGTMTSESALVMWLVDFAYRVIAFHSKTPTKLRVITQHPLCSSCRANWENAPIARRARLVGILMLSFATLGMCLATLLMFVTRNTHQEDWPIYVMLVACFVTIARLILVMIADRLMSLKAPTAVRELVQPGVRLVGLVSSRKRWQMLFRR